MSVITVSKTTYDLLRKKARAYDILAKTAKKGGFFDVPATKNASVVMKAFRESGKYSDAFMRGIERGLKRSAYFK